MILLYTTTNSVRCRLEGTERALRRFLREAGSQIRLWSLYRDFYQGRPFHNATDSDYLVDHDDPYWNDKEV